MEKKTGSKISIVIIGIVVVLFGAIPVVLIVGFLLGKVSYRVKNCQTLTPVALAKLYGASNVRPVYGQKCELGKHDLVRLAYNSNDEAKKAALVLREASPVSRRGDDYIVYQDDAAAYFSAGNKVFIVLMPGLSNDAKIKGVLKRTTAKTALAGFKMPATDEVYEDEILEFEKSPPKKPTKKPTPTAKKKRPTPTPTPKSSTSSLREEGAVTLAAKKYIESEIKPDFDYRVSVAKIAGKYAMAIIEPKGGETDSAGIILEKVNGKWIGRDHGTMFSDFWHETAPELFD